MRNVSTVLKFCYALCNPLNWIWTYKEHELWGNVLYSTYSQNTDIYSYQCIQTMQRINSHRLIINVTSPTHWNELEVFVILCRHISNSFKSSWRIILWNYPVIVKGNKIWNWLYLIMKSVALGKPEFLVPFNKAHVRTMLEYCVQAWAASPIEDKKALEKIRKMLYLDTAMHCIIR